MCISAEYTYNFGSYPHYGIACDESHRSSPRVLCNLKDRQMDNGVLMQAFQWYTPHDGSHWRTLAQKAPELARAGFTALWLPPAYKGNGGVNDVGYAVYDMYDLGEFDQKGSRRTKYGTREEYLLAIRALQKAGMQVYADTVFNHRIGADATEDVPATPYAQHDRLHALGPERIIRCYTKFDFAGRAGKYSDFCWNHSHFDAVDYDALNPKERDHVYLLRDKTFDDQVSLENGNFAFLMGCDLDCQNVEVNRELANWGRWYLDTTGVDGFRLDAIKHISASLFPQWLTAMRAHAGRDLFAVGEYWQGDLGAMLRYADMLQGCMHLFDVALHYNFYAASKSNGRYDMRRIFDNTLVRACPALAVTFVENHDSQPLQALESCVEPWFKPLAYALILLRGEGYPCVFEPDYYGARYTDLGRDGRQYAVNMPAHRYLLDRFLWARRHYAYGPQLDSFDQYNRVGWTRLGDSGHPGAMAVLMSDGPGGGKWMDVRKPHAVFTDITGHDPVPITTNADGWAEFRCPGGSLSVWLEQYEGAPKFSNNS
jgi:alpha-amylase